MQDGKARIVCIHEIFARYANERSRSTTSSIAWTHKHDTSGNELWYEWNYQFFNLIWSVAKSAILCWVLRKLLSGILTTQNMCWSWTGLVLIWLEVCNWQSLLGWSTTVIENSSIHLSRRVDISSTLSSWETKQTDWSPLKKGGWISW